MCPGDNHSCAITLANERRIGTPRIAPSGLLDVEAPGSEMVQLLARVRHTKRSDDHIHHLKCLKACRPETESEHVLVTPDKMAPRQALNVGRIIEVTFSFCGHERGVILVKALQAAST